jgi:hypothetical protein
MAASPHIACRASWRTSPRAVRPRTPILPESDLAFQFGDAGFDRVVEYWGYRPGCGGFDRRVTLASQWLDIDTERTQYPPRQLIGQGWIGAADDLFFVAVGRGVGTQPRLPI